MIGLVEQKIERLKPIPEDELREGFEWMQELRAHGFKPGAIKSKSTAGYTKGLTIGCIKALNRAKGLETVVVAGETYNAITGKSQDLLGIVDVEILEMGESPRDRYIQACGKDWQPHLTKMLDYDHVNRCRQILINPTHTLELWGWQQYPGFGKSGRIKTPFWYPRVQVFTLGFIYGEEAPTYSRFWEA